LTAVTDPVMFAELIGDLQSAANRMPRGEPRYSLRAHLADVLYEAGQKPRALDLYAQAVEEADELDHWAEVGRIAQNWAVALRGSGRPSVAALVFRRAAAALRAAEAPKLNAISVELEALRIEVFRGRAEEALPDLERYLSELRPLWRRHRAGESIAGAPDAQALAQAYTTALHLVTRADQTLERWQECLDHLAELDQVEREYGLGDYERARTRVTQCRPLAALGRMDEAQAVLEECLKEFLSAGDEIRQAAALSALADLWDERGDLNQSIAIERQALAVREIIADPEARAISHQNLSSLLDKVNRPEEAAGHRLAALVCRAVSGHDMGATIASLSADIRRAATRGERYELPRLSAVVANPDFASLRRFLEARGLAIEPLQAAIDTLIGHIHG
jgi:tetratricopeptide (TPR) repeat protein